MFSLNMHGLKLLKDKKDKTVLNVVIKIVNESILKSIKLWVDQGRKFDSKLMEEWLDNNDVLICLTHSECKSVIAERFIKKLKAKIYKKWQLMIENFILVIWIN